MAQCSPVEVDVYGETVWHLVTDGVPSEPVSFGRVELMLGGSAAVVARMLARLGHRPTLHSVMGSDALGHSAADLLLSEDVALGLPNQPGRTARIIAFLAAPGESYRLIADAGDVVGLNPGMVTLPAPGRIVYVTGFPNMYPLIEKLAATGCRAVIDTGFIPLLSDAGKFREHLRVLGGAMGAAIISAGGMSESEWHAHAGLCLELGADAAIVTLGARGVAVATPDGVCRLAARQVTAVDPLCAGDVFVAGYIAGRADGLGHAESAQFGQRVAEAKVGIFGGLPAGRALRTGGGRQ
jgi:sugar/nucleoside kinase (ribokinase family)